MADVNEQQAARGRNGFSHPAGASATVLADAFNRKVESHLGDRVVLKPLTRWNEAYKEFPRYVMEDLVSRYVDATEAGFGEEQMQEDPCRLLTAGVHTEKVEERIEGEAGKSPRSVRAPRVPHWGDD